MSGPRPIVVLVHGLWLHSTSWRPWADYFRQAGYDPLTPEWPGVPDTVAEARAHPERQAGIGMAQVIDSHARLVQSLPEPPVLVGHSFGGLIVEALMGRGLGRAGVAIDPAPVRGIFQLPIDELRSAFPVLKNPANSTRTVSLTREQFRFGFGNALTAEESDRLYDRWTIPGPGRVLFQAALANLTPRKRAETAVDTARSDRGPLLIVSGGADHTVPDSVSRAAYRQHAKSDAVTDLRQFPDRGHSLTIDSGWAEIAQAALDWLTEQKVSGRTPAP